MRDEHAQFFVAVAELCGAAEIAGLEVRVATVARDEVCGVPGPPVNDHPQLDGTGYARAVLVGDTLIDLADIRVASIVAPSDMPHAPG